jgi:hypothetical protein
MLQDAAKHYSDFHRLIWICGIIGTVGAAVGVCYGIIKAVNAVYNSACGVYANISAISGIQQQVQGTAAVVADTKSQVDLIKTNHLAHLEVGIQKVAETNQQLVAISTDIRDGIIKLVDRHERNA